MSTRKPAKFSKGDYVCTSYHPEIYHPVTKVYYDTSRGLHAYYLEGRGPYLETVLSSPPPEPPL